MTRLRSPPSPTPSYTVRAAIPRVSSKSSCCAATMRLQAASQSAASAPGGVLVWVSEVCLRAIRAMLEARFPIGASKPGEGASVGAMEEEAQAAAFALTGAQRRVVEHRAGAMLVSGAAGSGRTEAIA